MDLNEIKTASIINSTSISLNIKANMLFDGNSFVGSSNIFLHRYSGSSIFIFCEIRLTTAISLWSDNGRYQMSNGRIQWLFKEKI